MVQSIVEFLNGDTDYAEKKVVFKSGRSPAGFIVAKRK
jgi:hypothetical protein